MSEFKEFLYDIVIKPLLVGIVGIGIFFFNSVEYYCL